MNADSKAKKLVLILDNGGVMWTCAPCYQHRGLDPQEEVEGSQVTGAGPMLEWVAAGASTICL